LSKIRRVVWQNVHWTSAQRLPTRSEHSTTAVGIRWTVWRWAFVFIGVGEVEGP
jgi:hypothetical protein